MERNLCFIVMGFGKKKDPDTNRTIDLDATYKKIIRPAVESAGCKCIRADEIVESGIIDIDLKEHIQQSKRHGACNGIEVINALFLVLADQ